MNDHYDTPDPQTLKLFRSLETFEPPAEAALDRFTRLAAQSIHVPLALITFRKEQELLIKSCFCAPEGHIDVRTLPLTYMIWPSGQLLSVEDLRSDPRFATHPIVVQYQMGAYLGVPLLTPWQQQLGVLCVIDRQPRRWSTRDIELLSDLAEAVVTELLHRLEIERRQQAEHALQISEQRFQALMQHISDVITIFDPMGQWSYVSPSITNMLGYDAEEANARWQLEQVHPDDLPFLRRTIDLLGKHPGAMLKSRVRMQHHDGTWRVIETNAINLFDVPAINGIVGVSRDVTERQLAEEALRAAFAQEELLNQQLKESRDLLRSLFDSLNDGLVLLDQQQQVVVINQALARLLGGTPADLVGHRWPDLPVQQLGQGLMHTLIDGQQRRRLKTYVTADGKRLIFEALTVAIRNAEGEVVWGVLHLQDVTDRLQFEAMAIASERFAASGRLAATVAHEINSPLQAIQNCLELVARSTDEQRRGMYLELASEEIERISGIIQQLLDLHRPNSGAANEIDLNRLLERVLLLLGRSFTNAQVVVQTNLMPNLPPLLGHADQLTQVLLNLLRNAIDAMPQGGTLDVRTELREDGRLSLSITDTGVGITADDLSHLFDPFFTTKVDGLGIGLPISQKIITQHQGEILVQSSAGVGTTFTVLLPALMRGERYESAHPTRGG